MDEQIFTWPLSANVTSCIQNLKPFLFDQELVKMDNTVQHFSCGQKVGALTQVYLAFGLPLPTALRAAEADLGQLDAQQIG
jgi:hypothetical protein